MQVERCAAVARLRGPGTLRARVVDPANRSAHFLRTDRRSIGHGLNSSPRLPRPFVHAIIQDAELNISFGHYICAGNG